MSTGAGIAAAAGIGAAGSLLAGDKQSDAAKRASDTQIGMYERTREDLRPYREVGYAALGTLAKMFIPGYEDTSARDSQIASLQKELDLLSRPNATLVKQINPGPQLWSNRERRRSYKVERTSPMQNAGRIAEINARLDELRASGGEPSEGPDYSAFYKSPGYEFRMGEGIRALDRGASSRGRLRSGAHERELVRYGQGVASSEFNSYANRLASLAGLGQTSTAQTGSFGATAASQAGMYQQNQGTARASGYAGAANAATSGIGNYLFYAGLQGGK